MKFVEPLSELVGSIGPEVFYLNFFHVSIVRCSAEEKIL